MHRAAAPKRILMTGWQGFVGQHLTAALAAAWPDATLLTAPVDVCDAAAVTAWVSQAEPDMCIHLAAIASVPAAAEAQDLAWQVNLHGTLNVARAILAAVPSCQLLFASSADAYGESFRVGGALDEDAPLAPMNVYGATKAAADLALGSMVPFGLRVVRLRLFNHIGAGQSPSYAVASFARQIARIEAGLQPPVLQVGNLETFRDFVDVRDACAAYIACIEHRASLAPGAVINIASGTARRMADVVAALLEMSHVKVELKSTQSRARGTDIIRACGNAARARDLLVDRI
jgi:GDP-4-dehydro-6-deoxy-D-mannose reductase